MVAFSSGNHAQGVAAAAKLFGMPALIVMPSDAPRPKIEGTRALGAEIVLYDRRTEDREAIAAGIREERGATLIKPYDDPGIMAGQGTAGLEIAEDAARFGVSLDTVLAPCSGGGLVTGVALGLNGRGENARSECRGGEFRRHAPFTGGGRTYCGARWKTLHRRRPDGAHPRRACL